MYSLMELLKVILRLVGLVALFLREAHVFKFKVALRSGSNNFVKLIDWKLIFMVAIVNVIRIFKYLEILLLQ